MSFDNHSVEAGALSCSVKKPTVSVPIDWSFEDACTLSIEKPLLPISLKVCDKMMQGALCCKWKLWSPNLNEMHYFQWTE